MEGRPRRFDLVADLAQMKIRHAPHVEWRHAPRRRFALPVEYHPGPLLFYFLAPMQKAFGSSSTGMYVGTVILSCVSVTTCVAFARAFGSRAHAVAVLLVLLGWLAAFGNVSPDPWPRVVVLLPLIAFFVLAAFLALGEALAAPSAVFFGTISGQTHLSTISTVVVALVAALASFVVHKRRKGIERGEWRQLVIAAGLTAIFFFPPLLEQLRAPPHSGNITEIFRFFMDRTEPYRSLPVAIRNWVNATSWLPQRLWNLSLADDNSVPFAVRWDAVPAQASSAAWSIAAVHVLAIVASSVVAYRRRDHVSLALVASGALGDVLSIVALRAIIGEDQYSLLVWTTAPSSVVWMGVLSTFITALGGARATAPGAQRSATIATVATLVALVGFAAFTTVLQCRWIARFPYAPASDPAMAEERRQIYAKLRELGRDGAPPVLHMDGAWLITFSMMLEFDKDHGDVRLADNDQWEFPGSRTADGGTPARYVWFEDRYWPVSVASCVERVGTYGDITIYVAPHEVLRCPAPANP